MLVHQMCSKVVTWLNSPDDEEEVVLIQDPAQVPPQHPANPSNLNSLTNGQVNGNPHVIPAGGAGQGNQPEEDKEEINRNVPNPAPMAYWTSFSKGDTHLLKKLDKWSVADSNKTVKEWIVRWHFTKDSIKFACQLGLCKTRN
jgi:hypothetical protein